MDHRVLSAAPLLLGAEATQGAPADARSRLVESPLSTANLVETAVGLLLVLALVLGLAWLAKRYMRLPGNGNGRGQVQVLGGVSLGSREKAVLLSVEGRRLLVGVAPGRVQTLMELDGEPAAAADFAAELDAASGAANAQSSGGHG